MTGVASVTMGVGVQPYTPVKLPSSREAHLKAMAVGVRIQSYKVFWQVPSIYMAFIANIWLYEMHTSTQCYG